MGIIESVGAGGSVVDRGELFYGVGGGGGSVSPFSLAPELYQYGPSVYTVHIFWKSRRI